MLAQLDSAPDYESGGCRFESCTGRMFDRNLYNRERYYKLRQARIEELGGQCVACGSEYDLEFDHIDPQEKEFDISDNLTKLKVFEELDKCQLLCHSCHKTKSDEAKEVPHGGGLSGKRNCKCRLCKDRKNEYMRAWKARKRSHVV